MKKIIVVIFLFLVFVFLTSETVAADAGPRPTAEVKIVGVEEEYSFDLLIPLSRSVDEVDGRLIEDRIEYDYYKNDFPERLIDYQDDEGYASCTLYSSAPCKLSDRGGDTFRMMYFSAPLVFKVALVTDDGALIVSESVDRTLFNAKFTFDLTDVDLSEDAIGVGTLSEELPFPEVLVSFLLRTLLTIGVELGVLALFMYRKARSYRLVGIVNFVSQSLLTLGVLVGYYVFSILGAFVVLVLGEMFVYLFEIIIYSIKLREKSVLRAIAYGFVANSVSFALSLLMLIRGFLLEF